MNLMPNQVSYQPTQAPQNNGKSKFSSEKAPADAFSAILERNRSAQSKEATQSQSKSAAKPEAKIEAKVPEAVGEEVPKPEGEEDTLVVVEQPAAMLLSDGVLLAPLSAPVNPVVPEVTQQAVAVATTPLTGTDLQNAAVLTNLSQITQRGQEKPLAQVAGLITSENVNLPKAAQNTKTADSQPIMVVADEKNAMEQQKSTNEGKNAELPSKSVSLIEGPMKQGEPVAEKAAVPIVTEGKEPVSESKADAGLPQQGQTQSADSVIIKVNDSSSLLQKQVYTQVSDKIVAQMDEGQSTFTMTLNPERLGKIDIKLVFEGGRVVVHVETQNPLTQHLLTNNMGELKSALQNSSIPVNEVHITQYLGDSGSGYDESKQFSQKEQGKDNRQNGFVEEEEFDDDSQKVSIAETGLNYRI